MQRQAFHLPSVRITRKPTFFHPFFLLKNFMDAPEAGKACHTDDGGKHIIRDEQRGAYQDYPGNQE